MSTTPMERYLAYVAHLKLRGVTLAEYHCPHCAFLIETLKPPPGQQYDSMAECPRCNKLHFKVVRDSGETTITSMHQTKPDHVIFKKRRVGPTVVVGKKAAVCKPK